MTTKTRQKPQRDRHQEIQEAASRVITDRGLAETRIQDLQLDVDRHPRVAR